MNVPVGKVMTAGGCHRGTGTTHICSKKIRKVEEAKGREPLFILLGSALGPRGPWCPWAYTTGVSFPLGHDGPPG